MDGDGLANHIRWMRGADETMSKQMGLSPFGVLLDSKWVCWLPFSMVSNICSNSTESFAPTQLSFPLSFLLILTTWSPPRHPNNFFCFLIWATFLLSVLSHPSFCCPKRLLSYWLGHGSHWPLSQSMTCVYIHCLCTYTTLLMSALMMEAVYSSEMFAIQHTFTTCKHPKAWSTLKSKLQGKFKIIYCLCYHYWRSYLHHNYFLVRKMCGNSYDVGTVLVVLIVSMYVEFQVWITIGVCISVTWTQKLY
jgi:hypothetical protein